tara:strand:- start:173 stop:373 length:201 start_codon:yes stop_codon:yes gene_type:complete
MNIDLFFASEYFFKILMKNDDKNNRVINQILKSTSAITDPNMSLIKKPKETKALPIRSLIFLKYFV